MSKVPRRLLLICVLSLCLLVSGMAVAVQTDQGQSTVRTNENTTNYLQPAETSGDRYQEVSINVASAVDSSAQELQTEVKIRSFNRELTRSTDPDRQRQIANDQLAVIDERYRHLDQYQEQLFEQHGEMSSQRFARQLVRLKTAVETQKSFREEVSGYASPSTGFLRAFNSLEQSLATRQPVTDQLRRTMTGSRSPAVVYSQSATDSLTLATIDDDTYLRQVTVRSERKLGGEDQFVDFWRDATDRTEELYPWTFRPDNIRGLDPFNLQQYTQVYAVRVDHVHGELTVYLDGATRNVFHENQRKPVDVQPVTRTVTNETADVVVSAALTNDAGPMEVRVTNQAGVPIEDANVTVDGTGVGLTDEAGTLWVVQPTGEFEIAASAESNQTGSVSVPDTP